jgi:hypothetical protein
MNTTVEYCFVKILQDHTILRWKANDFWQALLSYGVANTFQNRQKLYRLLYKKMHENVLVKHVNPENQQLSSYSQLSLDPERIPEIGALYLDEVAGQLSQSKWEEIQKKKILLANEMRLADKAMLDFPDRQAQIAVRKQQLQLEVSELEAYIKFVTSLG